MNKKIKVYGVPTCPFCKRTKEFLKDKGFDFEDLDVSVNQDLAKEMIEKSGQMSVPVIEIDGEIIIGFDKERIEAILRS
ncbi:MAG: glutathione S-transferase N-terminal domain-containing protein [Candidatus Atribacteria bacterium]